MRRVDSLEKTLMLGGIGGQKEKGTTEDEMIGWHHWLDGCESEWTPGVGDGQRGLACCDSWGHKESDTTERLNWTELNWTTFYFPEYCFVHECWVTPHQSLSSTWTPLPPFFVSFDFCLSLPISEIQELYYTNVLTSIIHGMSSVLFFKYKFIYFIF